MKAVVLVGGMGTRLRPLTLTTPKQMLPVVEVTMVERVLSHLAAHGVDEAILSMGYRPDPFLAGFPDDRCSGVALRYAVEPRPMDTAGAIRFAALHGEIDGTFMAVNGDVITDVDVSALVDFHHDRQAEATIHLTSVADPRSFGVVACDDAGRVQAFIEKPEDPPTHLINAGTYVLEPDVVERIPADTPASMERDTFPAMVGDGSLFALASDAYWVDVGTPATYLGAQMDVLGGVLGRPPAPRAVEARPGVWIRGGPVVDGEVFAHSLIGDAAYVAKGSQVSQSVVGTGARVEGARVVGSVLLPGAVAQAGAVVEGSIVGTGARVGERAELTALSVVGELYQVDADSRLRAARVPSS